MAGADDHCVRATRVAEGPGGGACATEAYLPQKSAAETGVSAAEEGMERRHSRKED